MNNKEKINKFLGIYYRVILFSFVIVMIMNMIIISTSCYEEITPQESYWSDMFPLEKSENGCQLITKEELKTKQDFYRNRFILGAGLLSAMIIFNQLNNRGLKK
jgi:hypothetical protein